MMNKKTKLYLLVTIILMVGISHHLAVCNITKAAENMDSETSLVISEKSNKNELEKERRDKELEIKRTEAKKKIEEIQKLINEQLPSEEKIEIQIKENSKEQIDNNKSSSKGAGTTEIKNSVGEKYFGRYRYARDEGLVRDWEDKIEKEIILAVRIWVDSDGNVTKSEISKSCGYLDVDQLVLDSIKKRVFKPSNDGKTTIGIIEFDLTGIR